jgi:parallel beta-helix repeat protein
MTITTVLMLLVVLPNSTNIIIIHQQASATQGDTRTPTTANAACGQVVEGLVELNSDLNCSGDGLIVGAASTTIRLNGHTIRGPGPDSSNIGISVGNEVGVTIEGPGTIEQYQAAILASGGKGISITSLTLRGNQIALFSTDTEDLQASQNILTVNSIGGGSLSSTGLRLTENLVSGNLLAGITLNATNNSLISKNNVRESPNGIFVDSQSNGNRIESNDILENELDLNNANGLSTDINQNQYSNNNCETSNPSGLCTTSSDALQPEQSPGQQEQLDKRSEDVEQGSDDQINPYAGR